MSYMHIDNLYKDTTILMFRHCYAMEKIHGTSAHVSYHPDKGITFFAGGSSHEEFLKLFDHDYLYHSFLDIAAPVTIYGESYGGKIQGMRDTYGDKQAFIAFEVKIGDTWLNVVKAEDFARTRGLDFVHFVQTSTELADLDKQRDADSMQAIKNGLGPGHMREGIVLRPLEEMTMNTGRRVIAKHKRDEFRETKTPRKVGQDIKALESAHAAAAEWVTEERLNHVLDAIQLPPDITNTGRVIKAMIDDILREAGEEVKDRKGIEKAIGRETALMFKRRISRI